MPYLILDGDDVGSKVEAHLLANDLQSFTTSSNEISTSIERLANCLNNITGVSVISVGGDSILAQVDLPETSLLHNQLSELQRPGEFTFSAGIGKTLRESFIALRMAKTAGKCITVTHPS